MIIYAVFTVACAVAGYFIGKHMQSKQTTKKDSTPPIYAAGGALVGAVICLIMWVAWGEKNSM